MSFERDELLAAFLAGDDLSLEERVRLVSALEGDAGFAAAARELATLERLLRIEHDATARAAFARRVSAGVRPFAVQASEPDEAEDSEPPAWEQAEMSDAELEAVAGAGPDAAPEQPEPDPDAGTPPGDDDEDPTKRPPPR